MGVLNDALVVQRDDQATRVRCVLRVTSCSGSDVVLRSVWSGDIGHEPMQSGIKIPYLSEPADWRSRVVCRTPRRPRGFDSRCGQVLCGRPPRTGVEG